MGDSRLAPMIRMASLSYLFIGILGVCRGYYQKSKTYEYTRYFPGY